MDIFLGVCGGILMLASAVILLVLPLYIIGYKESKFDNLDSTSRAMLGVVAGFCFLVTMPISFFTCGIVYALKRTNR